MIVFKLKYKDGRRSKNWYYRFSYQGKEYQKAVCPSKAKTEEAAIKKLMELKGQLLPEKNEKERKRVLFEGLIDRFLEEWSRNNKRSYQRDVTSSKSLLRRFRGRYIDTIRPHEIERYRDDRKKAITPSSVNRELACLKTMFNKGIFWELTNDNPVTKVKMLRENRQRSRYLTRDEINRLLDVCKDHLRPIVVFALNTGMRLSEILGLTWDRVNLEEGIVELVETKSGDIRQVPLTPDARNAIYTSGDIQKGHVFTYEDKPILRVSRSFTTACKKAGIEDLRFHDLRHTWASYFMMNGGNLYDLMEMGGWKSIDMVRRYAHLDRKYRLRVMNVASPTAGVVKKSGKGKIAEIPISVSA
jgi:integrase